MPKISIIIPVYNVENYLDICLDSVLLSTFDDFEVICIDDGSTDSGGYILDQYAKLDNRIRVYHRENHGLSATRNYGLKKASGKYIVFIDSDDWISRVMLERLYKNIEHYHSDFCFSGLFRYNEVSSKLMRWELIPNNEFKKIITTPVFNEASIPPFYLFNSHVMAWNKIYRKSFIKNFRFPEGLSFEDNPFYFQCYLNAQRISYDLAPLYYYRVNRQDSIIENKDFRDLFKIYHMCENILHSTNKYEKYKTSLLLYKMNILFVRTIQSSKTTQKDMFLRLQNEFKNIDYSEFDYKFIEKQKIYQNIQTVLNLDFEEFVKIFCNKGL